MKHKYRNIGLPVDINLGLIYLTNYSSNDLKLSCLIGSLSISNILQ